MSDQILNGRQIKILQIVSEEPCLPWTLTDSMDEDVNALLHHSFVKTYWGVGGTHWAATDLGRAALSQHQKGDGHGE